MLKNIYISDLVMYSSSDQMRMCMHIKRQIYGCALASEFLFI